VTTVGAYEATTRRSHLVEQVERGETITITRDGREVARDPSTMLHAARQHRLSAYAVAYLVLAGRSGCPLAARDERLAEAGRNAGVEALP